MVEEKIEVLDSEGEKTGEILGREEVHERELPHPVAYIWVYNDRREVLMQKRSKDKKVRPEHWGASVGGHIRADEEPLEESLRELEEELGIEAEGEDLEYIGTYSNYVPTMDGKQDKEFAYTFLLEYNKEVSDAQTDDYEVAEVRFIPLDELFSDINSENPKRKYSPYGDYYDWALKAIEERVG